MRDVAPYSVMPMLLGNTKDARRLARRLLWYFSLRSYVFDRCPSWELRLMLAARFSLLPDVDGDEFLILTLERFAAEHDDMTFLLVSCSPEANNFLKRNRFALEDKFLIRSSSEMLKAFREGADSPYASI